MYYFYLDQIWFVWCFNLRKHDLNYTFSATVLVLFGKVLKSLAWMVDRKINYYLNFEFVWSPRLTLRKKNIYSNVHLKSRLRGNYRQLFSRVVTNGWRIAPRALTLTENLFLHIFMYVLDHVLFCDINI